MKKLIERVEEYFLVIAILLLGWFIFAGEISFYVMLVGFFISLITAIILPINPLKVFTNYAVKRFALLIVFILYMLLEVFLASYRIAFLAFHPSVELKSSIFAYDYNLKSETGVFLLSTVITLTPGTIVLDICSEKKRLYIHLLGESSEKKDSTWRTIGLMENWLRRIFF